MSGKSEPCFVCPACSCLCDDLQIKVRDNAIVSAANACPKGVEWFSTSDLDDQPMVEGHPADLASAIQRSVDILNAAKSPLVCGLDGLTTQAQKTAVKIGLKLAAAIDTTFSKTRSSTLALQSQGKVSATLGEVNTRSDLIVFWFCDPVTTHPRLIERYCQSAKTIIVIAESPNATSEIADEFVQVKRTNVLTTINQLRLANSKADHANQFSGLAAQLSHANYGTIFYGPGESVPDNDAEIENLYRLVRELNSRTKFVTLGLTDSGNTLSAENVLTWLSGYPMAVTHHHDLPAFFGNENTSQNLLEQNICDAVLICSSQSINQLSELALDNLSNAKSIMLSSTSHPLINKPTVALPVSAPGLSATGDWARLDDVLLPLSAPRSSDLPSAERLLTEIQRQLRS